MAQIKTRAPNKHLVRIFLGRDAKGKRVYLNRTITGTKKNARDWAREKERARDLRLPLESLTTTLNDLFDRWLKFCAQHVRDNTHYWYTQLMQRYVRPTLGEHRLAQLQPLDVQNLYTELLEKGLAGRTVRHVHARLVTALNQAVIWRLIQQNPASLVKAPKIVKNEMHFLSPKEAALFLSAAKDDSYCLLLTFALVTGMRPEEYLGLQWKELDLTQPNRGVARVRRVVTPLLKKGGGWKWSDVKSPSSRRDVYFPFSLVRELLKHRIKQNELRLRLGHYFEDNDLVFATKTGNPIHRKFVKTYHLRPTLERAELPIIRLYDLRHSYVTLSLLSGVKPKVVSEQAGHSSVAFTLDHYAHVIPEEREGASDMLENLLFSATGTQ